VRVILQPCQLTSLLFLLRTLIFTPFLRTYQYCLATSACSSKRDFDVFDDTAEDYPQKRVRVENSSLIERKIQYNSDESIAHEYSPSAPQSATTEHTVKTNQVESTAMGKSNDNVPPRASLLGMPRELRNMIYGFIFPSIIPSGRVPKWLSVAPPGLPNREELKEGSMSRFGGIPLSSIWWCLQREELRSAPLQINRQVRNEIFSVFLKDGYFHS